VPVEVDGEEQDDERNRERAGERELIGGTDQGVSVDGRCGLSM
jgi:hypothetical protein